MKRPDAEKMISDLTKAASEAYMSAYRADLHHALYVETVAHMTVPWGELLAFVMATCSTDGVHASSRTPHGQKALRALVKYGHMVLLEDDNGRVVARKADQ